MLSTKYSILDRIGAANWAPTNHTFSISTGLANLILNIGTKAKLNFGAYVVEKVMKHADTYVVKLPIVFPCFLTELVLSQHPHILGKDEEKLKKVSLLIFDNKRFAGSHVQDIETPTTKNVSATEDYVPASTPTEDSNILSKLIDQSKAHQDTIKTCTRKKARLDILIM